MPENKLRYEICECGLSPIRRIYVSGETACFIFFSNGGKTSKSDARGLIVFSTFAEAKEELIRRAKFRVGSLQDEMDSVLEDIKKVEALEDSDGQAE